MLHIHFLYFPIYGLIIQVHAQIYRATKMGRVTPLHREASVLRKFSLTLKNRLHFFFNMLQIQYVKRMEVTSLGNTRLPQ